ncbi:MAG: O-antigen ligase family protein [Rhodobacteraceae bacterium]|nr:O-antigen ligase family protein [Paracoccaceae bacterium]
MIDFDKRRSTASERIANRAEAARQEDSLTMEFEEIALQHSNGDRAVHGTAGRRINDVAGWALIVFLAIAPIPLASARPVFWLAWSVLLFLTLACYMLAMQLAEPGRKLAVLQVWPLLGAAALLPVAGGVQYFLAMSGARTEFAGHAVPLGSIVPEATLIAVIRLLGLLALFILAYEVSTRAQRVSRMAWALFAIILAHGLWAIIALIFLDDFVIWGEKIAYEGVATGTFVNRNSFATFMGMGLVAGVCLIMERAHRPHVRHPSGSTWLSETNIELAALWGAVAIIALALVLTQSRMGVFAGFVAAWCGYIVMSLKYHDSISRVILRGAALSLAGGVVFLTSFQTGVLERGVLVSTASDVRTDLYLQVLSMIREAPFGGTGLDSFAAAYELVHRPPVSSALIWDLAHSTYLTWWQEAGLIIGSLPIVILCAAAVSLVRTIRRRRTNYVAPAIGLAAIVLVALHSLVDFSMEIQANAMVFTVILGMALGRLRRKEDRS